MYSPFANHTHSFQLPAKPWLRLLTTRRTRSSFSERTHSTVLSVEPSSTTRISRCWYVWTRAESRHCSSHFSPFSVGIQTETKGSVVCGCKGLNLRHP